MPGRAAERAEVASAQRQPVGVEALEQQLGGLASDTERIAERCERDRIDRREQRPPAVVEVVRDGESVSDAPQAPGFLEERRELAVVDLVDALLL